MTYITVKVHDGERLAVKAPYELKGICQSLTTRKWDGDSKAWLVPMNEDAVADVHSKFKDHADIKLDSTALQLLMQWRERNQSSVFKNVDDLPEIPGRYCNCPDGPTPGDFSRGTNPLSCEACKRAIKSMNHQRQAYWFAKDRNGFLAAMGMGTGKSKVMQALVDGNECMRVLIVCPRRAVPVWPHEFAFHSDRDWLVVAPKQSWSVAKRVDHIKEQMALAFMQGRPVAICVNTEATWRPGMKELTLNSPWDAMVIDESHKIKSPSGKASKHLALVAKRVPRVYLGTGTPMPHSPLDIFAQFRALKPGVFGTNFHAFRRRYAVLQQVPGAPMGAMRVIGYQNTDELNQKWGEHAFICGEEVLDLPPYWHTTEYTELEPSALKVYKQMDNDFVAMAQSMDDEDDGHIIVGDNALTKLLRLQQITAGWVRDDEGEYVRVSTAKEELLEDVMSDFAEREPLVVCCRFQHDLDIVKSVCEKQERRYGEISGRVSETSPVYGLSGRSMREDIDVVAVQIQAGGVGIDLTRAAYNIMYSVGYSLGDYDQFLKRTHRPGQTRATHYIHLVVKGTKDEAVYAALQERQDVVQAMIRLARAA